MQTVADLPLLPNLSITAVRATLGRQDIALLIDTGAVISLVSRNGADRFDLRPGADAHYTVLSGIGGVTFAPIVTVRGLGLGRGLAPSLELPVAAEFRASVDGLPVFGLFGADFLSNYDVDLDVPHGHLGLYRAQGCADDLRPFDPPYFAVPFRDEHGHIALDIKLNGQTLTAILDSGASATLIGAADAARAGATADLLASDQVRTVRGIDSRALEARRHRFASLEIGDERMSNMPFMVAGSATGGTLLGRDVLRFNRVWISYRRHLLFIQPALPDRMVHR